MGAGLAIAWGQAVIKNQSIWSKQIPQENQKSY